MPTPSERVRPEPRPARAARLRHDGLGRLVHDAAVGRAADVAQQLLPALRRAPGEQAAAVDRAERHHHLAARVQLPKACAPMLWSGWRGCARGTGCCCRSCPASPPFGCAGAAALRPSAPALRQAGQCKWAACGGRGLGPRADKSAAPPRADRLPIPRHQDNSPPPAVHSHSQQIPGCMQAVGAQPLQRRSEDSRRGGRPPLRPSADPRPPPTSQLPGRVQAVRAQRRQQRAAQRTAQNLCRP